MYKRIELLSAVIASYCVAMQFLKSPHPAFTRPRPYLLLLTLLITVFALACSGSDGLEGAEG